MYNKHKIFILYFLSYLILYTYLDYDIKLCKKHYDYKCIMWIWIINNRKIDFQRHLLNIQNIFLTSFYNQKIALILNSYSTLFYL